VRPEVTVESPLEDLELMFQTTGWLYVAKPAIERRVAHLTSQLVVNQRLELWQVREIQAQIKLLREMTERRREFFSFRQPEEKAE
jgi:hypothetical protein